MQTLFEKERRVYEFIKDYIERERSSPSYQEIQQYFGYRSASSVQQFVEQLVKKGYLRERAGSYQKRALELSQSESSDLRSIPLEGVVAAGALHEAIQNREYVALPKQLFKNSGEYFALRVKGDSMVDACILDGDIAIIRRMSDARNGQTVVALVGEEATIKTFYKHTGKQGGKIELRPANAKYRSIFLDHHAEIKILGVLSSVIRQCE